MLYIHTHTCIIDRENNARERMGGLMLSKIEYHFFMYN